MKKLFLSLFFLSIFFSLPSYAFAKDNRCAVNIYPEPSIGTNSYTVSIKNLSGQPIKYFITNWHQPDYVQLTNRSFTSEWNEEYAMNFSAVASSEDGTAPGEIYSYTTTAAITASFDGMDVGGDSTNTNENNYDLCGTTNGHYAPNQITYNENPFIETELSEKIFASPSSGSKTVGSPFTIDVQVTGASESAFNAARANVAVSSNLTINSIHPATSNSCNLQYTTTPTTSNPSFAGAIFGYSSDGCTVYTMTLTPNDEGSGTATFTNGSVKSYEDNSEILDGVTNASFTLGEGPTPTPTVALDFAVTSPLQTYRTNYDLSGTKLSSITSIFVNGDDEDSEYPSSTTWEVPVTLSLGDNNFTIYGSDGDNQTSTQNIIVDRHTLGDINGDGEIDLIDASLFAVDWDKTEDLSYILSDMNDDGNVDLTDLSILAKLQ